MQEWGRAQCSHPESPRARLGSLSRARDHGSLHELDRAKSEFVANVSHELRTPLTSLKLSIANLLDVGGGELPPGQQATLQRVQGELERLIRLVNQLLEMARLDAGAIPARDRLWLEHSFARPSRITSEAYRRVLGVDLEDPYLGPAPEALGGEGGRYQPSLLR